MSETNLNLDLNEIVLIRESSVAHGGIMAIYTDELILTNKKIICIGRGIFGGKRKTHIYPLDQLKVFNGEPQAKLGKLSNGRPCLILYLKTGEEYFNFQSGNKAKIEAFINELKKLYGIEISEPETSKKKKGSGFLSGIFSSAFGGNSKEEDNDDEEYDEDEKEEDESMLNYQLESDEVIIKSSESVCVDGSINTTADIILITNKRLVIEYTTGFWSNKQHIDTFNYSDLKQYKGEPQVRLGKYDDSPVLELSFSDAQLYLNFENEGNEKKQKIFIQECVNAILENIKPVVEEKSISANPIPAPVINQDNGLICTQCGKKNNLGVKFCTECGTKLEEVNEAIKEENKAPKEKLTLDQQIELLQKLKGLVDAGVLSQEEFEAKKKEIL